MSITEQNLTRINKLKEALAGHEQLRSSIFIKGRDGDIVAAYDALYKRLSTQGYVTQRTGMSTPTEIKNRLTILFMMQPCVRKRGESDHAAFEHDEIRDVDNVITTKDLGDLLRLKGINIADDLEPTTFDSPFQTNGVGSGAGQLFGATGGVMEAAVRSVYDIVMGVELPRLEARARCSPWFERYKRGGDPTT